MKTLRSTSKMNVMLFSRGLVLLEHFLLLDFCRHCYHLVMAPFLSFCVDPLLWSLILILHSGFVYSSIYALESIYTSVPYLLIFFLLASVVERLEKSLSQIPCLTCTNSADQSSY